MIKNWAKDIDISQKYSSGPHLSSGTCKLNEMPLPFIAVAKMKELTAARTFAYLVRVRT